MRTLAIAALICSILVGLSTQHKNDYKNDLQDIYDEQEETIKNLKSFRKTVDGVDSDEWKDARKFKNLVEQYMDSMGSVKKVLDKTKGKAYDMRSEVQEREAQIQAMISDLMSRINYVPSSDEQAEKNSTKKKLKSLFEAQAKIFKKLAKFDMEDRNSKKSEKIRSKYEDIMEDNGAILSKKKDVANFKRLYKQVKLRDEVLTEFINAIDSEDEEEEKTQPQSIEASVGRDEIEFNIEKVEKKQKQILSDLASYQVHQTPDIIHIYNKYEDLTARKYKFLLEAKRYSDMNERVEAATEQDRIIESLMVSAIMDNPKVEMTYSLKGFLGDFYEKDLLEMVEQQEELFGLFSDMQRDGNNATTRVLLFDNKKKVETKLNALLPQIQKFPQLKMLGEDVKHRVTTLSKLVTGIYGEENLKTGPTSDAKDVKKLKKDLRQTLEEQNELVNELSNKGKDSLDLQKILDNYAALTKKLTELLPAASNVKDLENDVKNIKKQDNTLTLNLLDVYGGAKRTLDLATDNLDSNDVVVKALKEIHSRQDKLLSTLIDYHNKKNPKTNFRRLLDDYKILSSDQEIVLARATQRPALSSAVDSVHNMDGLITRLLVKNIENEGNSHEVSDSRGNDPVTKALQNKLDSLFEQQEDLFERLSDETDSRNLDVLKSENYQLQKKIQKVLKDVAGYPEFDATVAKVKNQNKSIKKLLDNLGKLPATTTKQPEKLIDCSEVDRILNAFHGLGKVNDANIDSVEYMNNKLNRDLRFLSPDLKNNCKTQIEDAKRQYDLQTQLISIHKLIKASTTTPPITTTSRRTVKVVEEKETAPLLQPLKWTVDTISDWITPRKRTTYI